MPKGTKVHKCVDYLKHKYGYGPAIGICQKSTRQNYITGKKLRRKRRKKKKSRRKKRRKTRRKTRKKN